MDTQIDDYNEYQNLQGMVKTIYSYKFVLKSRFLRVLFLKFLEYFRNLKYFALQAIDDEIDIVMTEFDIGGGGDGFTSNDPY